MWHSVVQERGEQAGGVRKAHFDKKARERSLEEGDLVLIRIPGLIDKLEESWKGPYEVVGKLNRVDYRIKVSNGRTKVVHINNTNKYMLREESLLRLTVVAEDFSCDPDIGVIVSGECPDFRVEDLDGLEREFPGVFSEIPGRTDVCKLVIDTVDAQPVASVPYRVPDRLKEGVRLEVQKLVELGVAVESTSPWASPIVPVPKEDGSIRLCVDYRRLNTLTLGDPYYMATLDEILERVGRSGCISKLDLCKGFYQIEVEESSRAKTAFITPYGKYEFLRMPFGLRNAPSIFQRTMEVVLRDCFHCSAPYIDDIVVFSRNGREHVQHLREVLGALQKNGLTMKREKCLFGRTRLQYLGHVIGGGEMAVPSHRATAMAEFKQPRTKKDLRSFLGTVSYYRQFVKDFAKLSSRLTPDTSKFAPHVVNWDLGKLEAFHQLKVCLVSVCVLTVPSLEDVFILNTDASGQGIGATLNIIRDGEEKPVAYFSRQLQGAQKHYSATELEGLAVFKSVHFFSHYLWGKPFTVRTDYKALVSLLKSRTLSKRLHGWVIGLADFDMTIIYREGTANGDADGLSRQAWSNKEEDLREERQTSKGTAAAAVSSGGEQLGTALISFGGAVGTKAHIKEGT